jgi:hypothetical protein
VAARAGDSPSGSRGPQAPGPLEGLTRVNEMRSFKQSQNGLQGAHAIVSRRESDRPRRLNEPHELPAVGADERRGPPALRAAQRKRPAGSCCYPSSRDFRLYRSSRSRASGLRDCCTPRFLRPANGYLNSQKCKTFRDSKRILSQMEPYHCLEYRNAFQFV